MSWYRSQAQARLENGVTEGLVGGRRGVSSLAEPRDTVWPDPGQVTEMG